MKYIILSLLFSLVSPAFASNVNPQEILRDQSYDSIDTTYTSWCMENNVMQEGSKGEALVMHNCSEQGLICQEKSTYRMHNRIIYGVCEIDQMQ